MGYGTGAIMAVPGQDERDWEFAQEYDLEIIRTVNHLKVGTVMHSRVTALQSIVNSLMA